LVSEYIKGLIGKGDEWSAWQYLGLVDALNGKQQSDETLTALAGLVNGANKLPYFSGVDQMATADLTAFARGLLGKADAATAKASWRGKCWRQKCRDWFQRRW
jgi:hypothetical protein